VEVATPLFKLSRLDELMVDAQLAPDLARQVAIGAAVWVRQGEGAEQQGRVVSVGAKVNEGNQGVRVRASLVPAPRSDLRPGQWVSLRLALGGRTHRVPEAALVSLPGGGEGVFVEVAAGRFQLLGVRVMGRQTAQAMVSVSGLSDEAKVVSRGTAALKALLP
jgi:multidrug efflux pump subunit AcrA (membrane-fusion protein)